MGSEWGTVCDDDWDDQDARVVCAEVGCADGLHRQEFGGGTGQIWLDDVRCTGEEMSLAECHHHGWGSHNCAHYEDAGLGCPLLCPPRVCLADLNSNILFGRACSL